MKRITNAGAIALLLLITVTSALTQTTQSTLGIALAELNGLKDKVKSPDTRTRVSAFHRVWMIALASDDSEVKKLALTLMKEPAASASDHIRMPAVYAIAEVANSSSDTAVKADALAVLRDPIVAGQLPIRLAAVDAINSVMCSPNSGPVSLQAVELLGEAVRSGNNGIRIPAVNAIAHIAVASRDDRVISAVIELMQAPVGSEALIGGMEVRLMAVVELERLGLAALEPGTKAKVLGMLQASANKESWEPEARTRASEAAVRVQNSMKDTALPNHELPKTRT